MRLEEMNIPEAINPLAGLPKAATVKTYLDNYTRWEIRYDYTRTVSWVILTHELIEEIVTLLDDRPTHEVMAGRGWLSYYLRRHGANIIETTDGRTPGWYKDEDVLDGVAIAPATEINPEAEVVVMAWPPYDTDDALDVWNAMRPGQQLLYIGEDRGGCNANDEFFEAINSQPQQRLQHVLRWCGIHDKGHLITKGERDGKVS